MKKIYKLNLGHLLIVAALAVAGCTKLNENEASKIYVGGSTNSVTAGAQLISAYNDLNTVMHGQDEIFSLQENTTDESLVPTRAGDWDDNGVWRLLHTHTWDATHGQVQQVFSNLGTLESDATTVLALSPSAEQAAEATFLRSLAQYYYLNLYGQVPYRTVANYNSIGAAPVMTPAQAVDTLVQNLTGIIPQLNASNLNYTANPNAARFLLMKVLLNKQWFLNPAKPGPQVAADMQTVHDMGLAIENSGMQINNKGIGLTPYYFDNFGPNNGGYGVTGTGGVSTENIFVYGNNGTAANPNGTSNGAIDDRWMMALHYNSWDGSGNYGNAGWNGFSTIAAVYTAFDPGDTRRGNVAYPTENSVGVSPISGLRVGLDSGAQLNEAGVQEMDRRGNLLSFNGNVSNIETDVHTLEGDGIRGIKYYPDYANYTSHPSNQLVMFRYGDVLLMIAESDLSGASGGTGEALSIVNSLHATRGAAPISAISLVNTSNLYDPTTILEERQKELWWESWRREDMIRMGVFLQAWDLKTADVGNTYLLFPIPVTQVVANPNLKQNPGY
jgi:starch-binding outer membrane protein, SusD/RagB family